MTLNPPPPHPFSTGEEQVAARQDGRHEWNEVLDLFYHFCNTQTHIRIACPRNLSFVRKLFQLVWSCPKEQEKGIILGLIFFTCSSFGGEGAWWMT
jgi:hypothetical protein